VKVPGVFLLLGGFLVVLGLVKTPVLIKSEMEELVEKLGESMRLLEGENASIVITEDDTADLRLRNGHCLIGRIMSERRVQKEAFRAFMAWLWKTTGKVAFKELEDNFWLIEFSSKTDKKRVQEGCPWLFDRNILILKEVEESTPPAQMDFSKSPCWIQVRDIPLICMNKEVGYKIGESIGKVEDVDVSGEGTGRGSSLRIKVHIDITKPLDRGRALWLNGKMVWVNFRYEKLPHFCFNCGRIFHNKTQCSDNKGPKQKAEDAQNYGEPGSEQRRRGLHREDCGLAREEWVVPFSRRLLIRGEVTAETMMRRTCNQLRRGKRQRSTKVWTPTNLSVHTALGMTMKSRSCRPFWGKRCGTQRLLR
jgi:hypothetical protein